MYTEIEKASLTGFTTMDKAIKAMSLLVETVVREAQDHVAAERAALLDAKSLSNATSSREIVCLPEQNTALLRLVETQKREGVKAQDELVKSTEAQIKGAYADGERRVQERVADLTEGNDKAVEALGAFEVDMGARVDAGVARGSGWAGALEKNHFEDVQSSTTKAIASYSTEVHKHGQSLTSSTSDAFERHSRAKKARLDATSAMATDVQSGMRTQQRAITGMQRSIDAHAGKIVSDTSKVSEAHRSFHSSAHKRLASVSASASTLQADVAREDLPTGRTPQRHKHHFVDTWELTRSRCRRGDARLELCSPIASVEHKFELWTMGEKLSERVILSSRSLVRREPCRSDQLCWGAARTRVSQQRQADRTAFVDASGAGRVYRTGDWACAVVGTDGDWSEIEYLSRMGGD